MVEEARCLAEGRGSWHEHGFAACRGYVPSVLPAGSGRGWCKFCDLAFVAGAMG